MSGSHFFVPTISTPRPLTADEAQRINTEAQARRTHRLAVQAADEQVAHAVALANLAAAFAPAQRRRVPVSTISPRYQCWFELMAEYWLVVDDLRNPTVLDGLSADTYVSVVRRSSEALALLKDEILYSRIYLDHDLGMVGDQFDTYLKGH